MPESRRKSSLRVVAPQEQGEQAPRKPVSVLAAAEDSERALLVAFRNRLARELDSGQVPPHALDKVARQIREFDKSIRLLDAADREEDEVGRAVGTADEAWDSSAI